jgi:hypothetical protein
MSGGGKSSANEYWPGFVDALTNVVIAMIFVVVVLAISLSFAAQQMGKKLAEEYIKKLQTAQPGASAPGGLAAEAVPDVVPPPTAQKTDVRIAVVAPAKAASSPPPAVRQAGGRLQLDYPADAFTLDSASQARLLENLATMATPGSKRLELVAVGPDMKISDNQRAAYLRLVAVRNALIEAGYSAEQISVRIDTTQSPASISVFVVVPE